MVIRERIRCGDSQGFQHLLAPSLHPLSIKSTGNKCEGMKLGQRRAREGSCHPSSQCRGSGWCRGLGWCLSNRVPFDTHLENGTQFTMLILALANRLPSFNFTTSIAQE